MALFDCHINIRLKSGYSWHWPATRRTNCKFLSGSKTGIVISDLQLSAETGIFIASKIVGKLFTI
jgi:hypothetical protein